MKKQAQKGNWLAPDQNYLYYSVKTCMYFINFGYESIIL